MGQKIDRWGEVSMQEIQQNVETVALGGGCFWCLEAIFKQLVGITRVQSGYAGGVTPDPTYEQVCRGRTGHAEVVSISFDPERIPFRAILEVFFEIHDPTTEDRSGSDIGPQYRSIILYGNERQKEEALAFIAELQKTSDSPIVTQVEPLQAFYPAEGYHEDYYARNENQQYCRFIISPKLQKFRKAFHERIKAE
jgi:peptide-methionine (S)-S-oxide reductase